MSQQVAQTRFTRFKKNKKLYESKQNLETKLQTQKTGKEDPRDV